MLVARTALPGLPDPRRGKVRDVYDLGGKLLIVATDRVSAFDVVLPDPIPDKGCVLNGLAAYWFEVTRDILPNHFLEADPARYPEELQSHREILRGRSMLVRKAEVLPVECVVRGYLAGSAWQDYRRTGRVGEYSLPQGMRESDRLPEPLFTPTTKAESGHDLPMTYREVEELVEEGIADRLRQKSLELFKAGTKRAEAAGVILADTKFEFGIQDGEFMVIDEIMTPDSSRFWPAEGYKPGGPQSSFDKQFIRDYLERIGWDKSPPAPHLPPEVVEGTAARYREAYAKLTGRELSSDNQAAGDDTQLNK